MKRVPCFRASPTIILSHHRETTLQITPDSSVRIDIQNKYVEVLDMRVYGFTENKTGVMEIGNGLEAEQEFVGGLIEVYCIFNHLDVVCNEEGKINGLELRVAHIEDDIIMEVIAGDCFVCRHNDEGEFESMFILFETGLRISELCGLTVKDIDFEERTINIDKQLQYTGGKKAYIELTKTNAGTRVLPMRDEVYEAFKRVISSRKKQKIEKIIDNYSGFLFLNSNGKPMLAYHWEKKFQHSVEKYNKIYKEELPKITPHVCRHTYCTNQAKRGIGVKTLQYLMGHADIQTTLNIYTHLRLEDAKDDLERLRIKEEIKKEMSVIDMADAKQALARVRAL